MIKRADGSYSKRGLWDNIRANKGSGKKPTAEMLKQEKKIKANTGKGKKYPGGKGKKITGYAYPHEEGLGIGGAVNYGNTNLSGDFSKYYKNLRLNQKIPVNKNLNVNVGMESGNINKEQKLNPMLNVGLTKKFSNGKSNSTMRKKKYKFGFGGIASGLAAKGKALGNATKYGGGLMAQGLGGLSGAANFATDAVNLYAGITGDEKAAKVGKIANNLAGVSDTFKTLSEDEKLNEFMTDYEKNIADNRNKRAEKKSIPSFKYGRKYPGGKGKGKNKLMGGAMFSDFNKYKMGRKKSC
jgi:hypothetical protein